MGLMFPTAAQLITNLKTNFKNLDTDGDGEISLQEWQAAVEKSGQKLTEGDVNAIFVIKDADLKGQIDLQELTTMLLPPLSDVVVLVPPEMDEEVSLAPGEAGGANGDPEVPELPDPTEGDEGLLHDRDLPGGDLEEEDPEEVGKETTGEVDEEVLPETPIPDPEGQGMGEVDPLLLSGDPMKYRPRIADLLPDAASLLRAQEEDPDLVKVKGWVLRGYGPVRNELNHSSSELRAYAKVFPVLIIRDQLLIRTAMAGMPSRDRYCLPKQLVSTLISDCHLSLHHMGSTKVTLYLQTLVWFPHMWSQVRSTLLECHGCVQKHNRHKDVRMSGCFFPREKSYPGHQVHIDLVTPLPVTKEGFNTILVIVDNYTSFCVTVPTTGKSLEKISRAFLDHWVHKYGLPTMLVSDNEFDKKTFSAICVSLNVEHRPIPFYNARSNSAVERMIGTLKRLLRATTRGLAPHAWANWLQPITFTSNITTNSNTGLTPFQFLHGWSPILPLATIVGLPEPERLSPPNFMLTRAIAVQ